MSKGGKAGGEKNFPQSGFLRQKDVAGRARHKKRKNSRARKKKRISKKKKSFEGKIRGGGRSEKGVGPRKRNALSLKGKRGYGGG